jgi:hypothetical protein
MTENDDREAMEESRKALEESRRALDRARRANADADATLEELHRTSVGIRVVVERNGYVDRFRKVLRGA